jgi:hypothetical protein
VRAWLNYTCDGGLFGTSRWRPTLMQEELYLGLGPETVHHSDQVDERRRLHLAHHLAAIEVYGRWANTHVRGNLFVRGVSVPKFSLIRAVLPASSRRVRSLAIASCIASSSS